MRERDYKMGYVSYLSMIIIHNNLRKTIAKRFCLTNREIAILISSYQIKENKEWSFGCFSFTDLRIIHQNIYYPYEISRSLENLCIFGYVSKKSHNSYEISLSGEVVLETYSELFMAESERIYNLLYKEGLIK